MSEIGWFMLFNTEENRINEALKLRKLTPKDVVSVTWNGFKEAYVVWFVKKAETVRRKGKARR